LVVATTGIAAAAGSNPTARFTATASSEAADCPSSEELAAEINRVAKRDAVTIGYEHPVAAVLIVMMSRNAGIYRAVLRVQGELAGERIFEDAGAKCTGLARAVSVSTALLLDHIESNKVVSQPPTPETTAPVSQPLRIGAELNANLTTGITRPGSLGYSLDTLVGSGRFSGGLGALWLPQRSHAVSSGNIELGLTAITLRGCWLAWQPKRLGLELLTCTKGWAGFIRASANGFDQTKDAHRVWIGAGAELELIGRIFGPVHWVLRADGLIPLRNERFTVAINGQRQLAFDPAPAAMLGGIGLMVSNF
jgi:hypothetical protein